MANLFRIIVKDLADNPKRIFLIDGLGALLTAFMLAGILTSFKSIFGMPPNALYILASIACLFMLYSFGCHLLLKNKYRVFLKPIIISNLLYCLLTFGLAIYFYEALTAFGIVYLLIEILVIAGLVFVEKRVYEVIPLD